jgi:hypothetical protein
MKRHNPAVYMTETKATVSWVITPGLQEIVTSAHVMTILEMTKQKES